MNELSDNDDPELPAQKPAGFQFGLLQLNILMLVLGIIFAWLRLIPFSKEYYWIYIIYFGSFGVYVVLRLPMILMRVHHNVRDTRQRKKEALEYAQQLRKEKKGDDPTDFH